PALAAVRDGRTRFIPKQWENTYFAWMENIRDWCISRQLWWGHRIPVWTCEGCGETVVAREDPTDCPGCRGAALVQEPDVLDTWFSSALWPFSTLGWPDRTGDLARYYPTTVLVTGFDIIFFWVARMMMMGLRFTGDVPFRDVYIHGLIRDPLGQKMSKSKGNVIDPLGLLDTYRTDALRFALAAFVGMGRDIKLAPDRTRGVLLHVLERLLRLLHPTMPFISEEIWQAVVAEGWGAARAERFPPSIMVAEYPRPLGTLLDDAAEAEMGRLMALVRAVRNLRSELSLPPSRRLAAEVFAADAGARPPPGASSGCAGWGPERPTPRQIPSGTTRTSRRSSTWRSRRTSAAATGHQKPSCLPARAPAAPCTRSNGSSCAACLSSTVSSARSARSASPLKPGKGRSPSRAPCWRRSKATRARCSPASGSR